MLNIVIPMAGLGSRFPREQYRTVKPFIEIAGRPMIEWVLENISWQAAAITIITRQVIYDEYQASFQRLMGMYPLRVQVIEGQTQGAACTVLHAVRQINSPAPLLIINCDQYVRGGLAQFIQRALDLERDGSILCFEAYDPKWSYAELNEHGLVRRVKEKEMISPYATVGVYFFRRGTDFVSGAVQMLLDQERVNGEYYVAPVYNYLIRAGQAIDAFIIPAEHMLGLGTPLDLEANSERLGSCNDPAR